LIHHRDRSHFFAPFDPFVAAKIRFVGRNPLDASPSKRAALRKLDADSIIETPSNRKTNA
jgi:hypothetical protein